VDLATRRIKRFDGPNLRMPVRPENQGLEINEEGARRIILHSRICPPEGGSGRERKKTVVPKVKNQKKRGSLVEQVGRPSVSADLHRLKQKEGEKDAEIELGNLSIRTIFGAFGNLDEELRGGGEDALPKNMIKRFPIGDKEGHAGYA